MLFLLNLKKAQPTESDDGVLTRTGMRIAHQYAKLWVAKGARDLNLERQHPELAGLFFDIRSDSQLAREHAKG
jgi:hypothetical protein